MRGGSAKRHSIGVSQQTDSILKKGGKSENKTPIVDESTAVPRKGRDLHKKMQGWGGEVWSIKQEKVKGL